MPELLGFEDREMDVPPCDSLAEALVLSYVLYHPHRLADVDLSGLLVFPEHRAIYQCMRRVYRADETATRFNVRLLHETERVHPNLLNVLDPSNSAHFAWWERRIQEQPGVVVAGSFDFTYWLGRLRRVMKMRQLVDQAQRIAERAWRGDVDGALAVAGQVDRPREVIRVDV